MKACPFCLGQIREEAVKCRHCGEYVAGESVRWREFHQYFESLSPDERTSMLESLTPEQKKFFDTILWQKKTVPLDRPTRFPFISDMEVRSLRRFVGVFLLLVLVGLASALIYPFIPPAQQLVQHRSPRFNVPLPAEARLIPPETPGGAAQAGPHEQYQHSATTADLLVFFERELTREGWLRYGTVFEGKVVYRKGDRMLGIILDEPAGRFTLVAR